ncbi:conserved Plasmodium protein, unknown function [Plasmodium knowlesi strain H]|uniref:DUF4536 domain-containing protein n=3 Tax=Plasmodium knowlesi TaxID=5850 RepID=A0A5K1UMA6_PLAKH|nr:conserved Plasmodium protein, unknown function [Plasmodium knowlesi strain H]OTN64952.1 Uncharacterized protein PKNOH_S120137300 [Plasmodium knowlesi]CAA9988232.1 conserved Plasmodium protein, unknown function [Plasmodium knowlesi strain H]SBO20160.1 conserved Plasmodium protein, unknown function [Plasmodium knowlesi strain H]SBO20531.1 conserved Plasmodium protein, unknown function [Plasmodium knowlesi strain H]VVS77706.1 conserved Plasmodium protein, unknown function [Plasmodium knowlesi |eukprot:XP_002259209.1 hypothetical protein, conserved in Plasmodium species [Plasmodium knowlesi strain H]
MNSTPDEKKKTDDCLFCRVTGTIALGGVSVYSFLKFVQAPTKSGDRKFFGFISLLFSSLAIYRAITPARPLTTKGGGA